jgi:leader peptidase (prepilin peptidase) / N-methyltransferase
MSEIVSAPEAQQPTTPAPEQEQEQRRPPTRELLPHGQDAAAVAVVSVALVVASFVAEGATGHALVGAVLCPVLVLLAAIDLRHHVLPNDIIFPAVLVIGVLVALASPGDFLSHLAAGAALGFFFLAFALFFAGSLGVGDAKLGFLLGLALGAATLTAVAIALFGLLLAALWILATQGVAARKKAIPFGPFLALGGIIGFFLG